MMGSLYNVLVKQDQEQPEVKVISPKKIRPFSKIVKFNAPKPVTESDVVV